MSTRLHGSATTTRAVRKAIQHSGGSLRALAARYGVNFKTVQKWRKRTTVEDTPMGPSHRVLSEEDEAMAAGFRARTLLPLDDCLYALQAVIPHLTRSSLHRCLRRHGVSQLSGVDGRGGAGQAVVAFSMGDFRIDTVEIRTEEGSLPLFLAIDLRSKFFFSEVHVAISSLAATRFLEALIQAVPYRVGTVLTNGAAHFGSGTTTRSAGGKKSFAAVCHRNGIAHRIIEPGYPWPPAPVEEARRLPRPGEAQQFLYHTRRDATERARNFRLAYNFGRRLKSLRGLTPYAFICKAWAENPDLFRVNPLQHTWD